MEKCSLLEDSCVNDVPELLHDIVQLLISRTSFSGLQQEIFYTLIILLMVENNLLPPNENELQANKAEMIDYVVNNGKVEKNSLECLLYLKGFKNIQMKLVMIPLGDLILVNAMLPILNVDTYSVCLPIERYVDTQELCQISKIFKNVGELTLKLKNNIICPIKSRIIGHYGYPSASLTGLPDEVIVKILLMLPLRDILNLSEICWKLKYIIDEDNLWYYLYDRDYGSITFDLNTSSQEGWKEKYIALHIVINGNCNHPHPQCTFSNTYW